MRPKRLAIYVRPFLYLLPLILWVSGCSTQQWKKHVLYSKDGIVLYAEHEEKEEGTVPQGFLHPAHVSPDTMEDILSQIVYKDRPMIGDDEDLLLFEEDDVAALGEPMQLALANLTPDERLRFLVVRDSWTSMLTGPKATSGVMFVKKEGVLNVAVDRIRESVTIGEGGDPSDVSFPQEPTEYSNKDIGRFDATLIPFGGTKLHVDAASNRRFPRWLEIELAEVRPAPTAATAVAAPGTAAAAGAAGTANTSTPGTTEGGSPAATEEERYSDLKEKLETLKRLKEDGVLTEEQYQKQFEKTMSEL